MDHEGSFIRELSEYCPLKLAFTPMKLVKLYLIVFPSFLFCKCSSAQSESMKETNNDRTETESAISIGTKIKFNSAILGEEKELYISLPSRYEQHVQDYPVIFTFEAEYLFESTSTIAKYMAARSKMPESIVVSIANKEFSKRHEANYRRWGGKPEAYIDFFRNELIPFMEENYRAADHRTIIGLSPSSGFLYECFMRQPDTFDAYLALSAHLEWDRVEGTKLIDEIMSKNNAADFPKTIFYLSRAESDFSVFRGSREAYSQAKEKLESYRPNKVQIELDVFEGDEHYLMALNGIRYGFEALYPNTLWRNPGNAGGWDKNANYAKLLYEDYYDQLSDRYGFDIYPVEESHADGYSISGMVRSAEKWGTNKQVIDLAELGATYFPNSYRFQFALANAYAKEGRNELAEEKANKSLELATKFDRNVLENLKSELGNLIE